MIAATIRATTVLTSALVAEVPDTVSSEANTHVDVPFESNGLKVFVPVPEAGTVTCAMVIEVPEAECWTAEKNARFKELARDEALRDLSVEELAELESLTRLRRLEVYPRSADEILWQRRQTRLTQGLVQALEAYVDFHETPRRT